jgi:molybdopterin molybdotransferase
MITIDKALQIVLESTQTLQPVKTPILDAYDLVLAEDIVSPEDFPPYDMALFDGYAMRSADILRSSNQAPVTLKLDGEAKIGLLWQDVVQPGHAVKVFAGGPLPEGVDTIVQPEHALRESANRLKVFKYEKPGEGIYLKGNDIGINSIVINKGKILTSSDIGVLAVIGETEVFCYPKPSVAIFASGQDLIHPGESLCDAKMRAGSIYTLQCQLSEYGAVPTNYGIISMELSDLKKYIDLALKCDMIIAAAGSALEDFDYLKTALQRFGLDLKFWKVAIKPGKPLIFGTLEGRPVFGIGNNQLSTMVVLEEFVRPAICKMQGRKETRRLEVTARLDKDLKGSNGVTSYVRAEIKLLEDGFLAVPTGSKTSHSVNALASANGFIVIPPNAGAINSGETVRVQIISEIHHSLAN